MRSTPGCFMALALLLAATPAAAKSQLGVIAGWNFSKLNIEGKSNLGVINTFGGGVVADLGINDRFGIRIEPSFITKGTNATKRNAYWGTMDGAEFHLDYINVPVMARYDLATTPTRGYVMGGMGVSFATQLEADLTQGNHSETADLGDVFSSTDVSLDIGAGVSIPAGGNRVTIDGRVAFGLVDINNGGTITFNGSPLAVPSTNTKSLDFRMFVSYLFPWPGTR